MADISVFNRGFHDRLSCKGVSCGEFDSLAFSHARFVPFHQKYYKLIKLIYLRDMCWNR